MDFDIETAEDAPKRLVITWEQAREWAEAELVEGRAIPIGEWIREEFRTTRHRGAVWKLECNEDGNSEEWILIVEEVPFWKVGKRGVNANK
jgi:hypothetical protein